MNKEQFDEKIDDLSRDAFLHHGLPFDEKAWSKMEHLLDNKNKRRRAILWWWFLPFAVLLIGSGIFILTSINKTTGTATTETKNQNLLLTQTKINLDKKPSDKNVESLTTEQITDNEENKSTKNTTALSKSCISNNVTKEEKNTTIKRNHFAQQQLVKSIEGQPTSASTPSRNTQSKNQEDKVVLTSINEVKEKQDERKGVVIAREDSKKITTDTLSIVSKKEEEKVVTKNKPISDSLAQKADTTLNSTAKKEQKRKESSIVNRFEISAAAATDISSVHFKKANKISTSYGFGITYLLNKKLSISTGIGIAKKLYNADSTDYYGMPYLPHNSILKNISADCRVIEIPVNIQYAFKENKNNTWLGVLGISNYFMKDETYVYDYTYNGMSKSSTYSYQKQNNHLLSILNIAIAYRQNINKQLSWQLSPFAKIPITGIGQGKVQLISTGIQGSLHFKLKN